MWNGGDGGKIVTLKNKRGPGNVPGGVGGRGVASEVSSFEGFYVDRKGSA